MSELKLFGKIFVRFLAGIFFQNPIKKIITVGILSLTALGCTKLHHSITSKTSPFTPKLTTTKNSPLPQKKIITAFNSVNIKGNMDVTLHTDSIKPNIIFNGDSRDISHIVWLVKNNVLYITLDKRYPKYASLSVDISSRYLKAFVYNGTGRIVGHNIHSTAFNLFLKNNGLTTLDGKIGLNHGVFMGSGQTKIQGIQSESMQLKLSGDAHAQLIGVANTNSVTMKGNSWLSLYWVKTRVLKIRLKESVCAQIAGVVSVLDAETWDNARFNGRYIRTMRAFVKTHDRSEADIATVFSQHTLAMDTSNIYYYKLPSLRANFMAENGAALDMRDWDRYNLKDETPYNAGP